MLNKYTWIFYMALLFNWQRILSSHERRRKRRNVRTFFRDKVKGSRVLYSICLKKKKKRNKQHLTADTVQNIVQTWITTTKQNFSQCILRIIRLLSKLDVNSKTEFYRLQIQTSKRFPRSHLNQNV